MCHNESKQKKQVESVKVLMKFLFDKVKLSA